ncbi:hypothetical protein FN846DRAFT_902412 [Sphaerosporella brunnea]|uniref:Uncharacterized protein n=1 Tax=Sphaerosporella brunnea TaxID=1250544 RepID=A0A5J5F9X0_9PEZI|nr:hypothetical protein FN846DRAFT_902412 [Sphaerosporella brunnea]
MPNWNFNFREVPNDQFYKFRYEAVCMGFSLKTDPTKVTEEELRKNILYNAALADMVRDGLYLVDRETTWGRHVEEVLKRAKDEADDKVLEVSNLNAELLDLPRQIRRPTVGTNPLFTRTAAPDPRIFGVKDINLPTYEGDTSVSAINDFLTAMERRLR